MSHRERELPGFLQDTIFDPGVQAILWRFRDRYPDNAARPMLALAACENFVMGPQDASGELAFEMRCEPELIPELLKRLRVLLRGSGEEVADYRVEAWRKDQELKEATAIRIAGLEDFIRSKARNQRDSANLSAASMSFPEVERALPGYSTSGEAGKAARQRFNKLFSQRRKVLEEWAEHIAEFWTVVNDGQNLRRSDPPPCE